MRIDRLCSGALRNDFYPNSTARASPEILFCRRAANSKYRLERQQECQHCLLVGGFEFEKPFTYVLSFMLMAAYRIVELK